MNFFFQLTFYFFGLFAIASALAFVTRRSPVAAAMWLVNTMFALAALYVMLNAQFVGAIQVLVYAGAIMVVFLFVVMLLNLGHGSVGDIKGKWTQVAALAAGVALLAEVLVQARQRVPSPPPPAQLPQDVIAGVAGPLLTTYLLPFEVTSVLLLVAIVGAVLLAKRRV